MRTHRIKLANLSLVTSALTQKNITFNIVDAPLSDFAYYHCDGWYGDDHDRQIIGNDTAGMVGIKCSLSGKQFHRLLIDIGVVQKCVQ